MCIPTDYARQPTALLPWEPNNAHTGRGSPTMAISKTGKVTTCTCIYMYTQCEELSTCTCTLLLYTWLLHVHVHYCAIPPKGAKFHLGVLHTCTIKLLICARYKIVRFREEAANRTIYIPYEYYFVTCLITCNTCAPCRRQLPA